MNASTTSARHARSPAGTAVVPATERAKQLHAARLLGRGNELLLASHAFAAWAAATQERKLQTHLKRCATMLKHGSLRQEYTRCFVRWLAFTQVRTTAELRAAIQLRQDVPLRSKSDFLTLARRYFIKWRTHLRQHKQRTATNVELLTALNKERLRSRTLLKWWRFQHMRSTRRHAAEIVKRENAIIELQRELQKATVEVDDLHDQIDAMTRQHNRLVSELEVNRSSFGGAEQQRQAEINELREAMRRAIELVEGTDGQQLRSLRKHTTTPAAASETASHSARQTRDTADALLRAVDGAFVELATMVALPLPPTSMWECLTHLRERRGEEAHEAAIVRAQRDELANAAQATRLALSEASPLLVQAATPIDSERESARDASLASSRLGGGPNASGGRSGRRGGPVSGRRSTLAPGTIATRSPSAPAIHSSATTPSVSLPNSPLETTLIDFAELPRQLVEESRAFVGAVRTNWHYSKFAASEVSDLQDAALRAIDALGGRGATNADFMAKPRESAEARAARSGNIADSLRNLCEDMVVVLVLTSLWSGNGASERVSEALERLWHRTQDLEATHTDYLRQLEQYTTVLHVAVGILRPPKPATPAAASRPRTAALLARRRSSSVQDDGASATPEQVDGARRTAEQLAGQGDRRPTELLDLCVQASQRAAMPTDELEGLLKSAQDMIGVAVGRRALASMSSSPAGGGGGVTPRSRLRRSTASAAGAPAGSSDASLTAGVPPPSGADVAVPLTAVAVTAALSAAIATAAEVLAKPENTGYRTLLDSLEHARAQHRAAEEELERLRATLAGVTAAEGDERREREREMQELSDRLKALSATQQQHDDERRRLQAELRESDAHGKGTERALRKQIDDFEKAAAAAKAAGEEVKRRLEGELKDAAAQNRASERALAKLQQEVDRTAASLQAADEAKKRLTSELREAEAQHRAQERALKKLQQEYDRAVAGLQGSEEAKKTLAAELKEAETQSKGSERALRQQVGELEKALQEAKAQGEKATRDLDNTRAALRDSEEGAKQLAADLKKAEAHQHGSEKELQKQLRALEREAAQCAEENRRLEDAVAGRERDIKDAAAALQAQRDEAAKAKQASAAEARQLRAQLDSAAAAHAKLEKDTDALRRQLAALEATDEQLRATRGAAEEAAATQQALTPQLLALAEENRMNNAVGVFLRDVLRDCLTRLHHLTRQPEKSDMSPRSSLTLLAVRDRPPPVLARDSDPSVYVEYVLRLDGNDSAGKRLVQEHLRENAAVHGLCEVGAGDSAGAAAEDAKSVSGCGGPADASPSTWEVVAELHDRLVLLYDRVAQMDESAVRQCARIEEVTQEKDQLLADAAAALQSLQPWSAAANGGAVEGAAATGAALRSTAADVTQALEAMHTVALRTRPLVELRGPDSPHRRSSVGSTTAAAAGGGGQQLPELVADVQDMADCLQFLSESVQHGILALGGTPDDPELSVAESTVSPKESGGAAAAGRGRPEPRAQPGTLHSRVLAARLEAICRETGKSVQEVRDMIGASDGNGNGSHPLGGAAAAGASGSGAGSEEAQRPAKLSDVLPAIRARVQELHVVKRESERMLTGLNRAFNDEYDSLGNSITSSSQRSVKPKRKPLPAFLGTPEAGLRLLQQQVRGRKKRATPNTSDFAGALQETREAMQERLGDLQKLRLVCRATLQVLEGSFVKDSSEPEPPSYGEALVALLTTQVGDLRQVMSETEEALQGYRSSLVNVTVGSRLHLLCDVVRSLKLERDSLKEDLARRGRQGNMLLNDLSEEVRELREELAGNKAVQDRLLSEKDAVSGEMDAQKRSAAELATKLAPLQHECNVLCDALVHTLRGLPGTPYGEVSAAGVHKNVVAALKAEQGKPLLGYVESAVQSATAHQRCLRDILYGSLGELRGNVAALRAQVTGGWDLYGRPMADAAAQQLVDTTEVLALENNMLRPRAVEREQLRRDKVELEAALADAKEARADVVARLEHAEDENTRLRRAVQDAQMDKALANGDEDDEEARTRHSGKVYSTASVDWERRMIDGATELTMDAVDSMSGAAMSSVFGSVVEETLRIYSGVRQGLRGVEAAYASASGRRGDEQRVQAEVEGRLQELRELSESADYLWSRLPVLYRVPYQ